MPELSTTDATRRRRPLAKEPVKNFRHQYISLLPSYPPHTQNAKLSVFTTRPAIRAAPFNWLTEFMATIMLVVGLKLNRRGSHGRAWRGPHWLPSSTASSLSAR